MSRIEELPEDFDEHMKLNDASEWTAEDEATYKEMYRNPNEKKGTGPQPPSTKSFEEVMSEISQTPLFMNNLTGAGGEDGENLALDALQALQYEGTKAEIGKGFKEQGNEMVGTKQWSDAKEFYTKGLAVLTDKSEDKWEKGEDAELEQKKEKELTEQIYVNRALCNLELKNYRSTILDCASALRINPGNIKAYYRSASALLALNKSVEASDACFRGLKLDPTNAPLKKLQETARARAKIEEAKDRRRRLDQYKKDKKEFLLDSALRARGVSVRGSHQAPDLEDAEIRLSPDPMNPESTLVFPVVLLYPMHAQSDFVKQFGEQDSLVDHLTYILPLPWDKDKQYQLESLDCYMETGSGGMAKIGKKLSLLEALTKTRLVIVDGLIKVNVVPTVLASKWIEETKKRRVKT